MKDLPELRWLRWLSRLDDRVRESHRSQDFTYDLSKDRTEGNKAAPATGRGLVTAHTGQARVPVAGLFVKSRT